MPVLEKTRATAVFLGSVAEEIGALYRRARTSHVDSVRDLLRCGELLKEEKQKHGHGEWLPWLVHNKEALGFTERAARMLIAGFERNRQLASDLEPEEALAISRQIWGHSNGASHRTGTSGNEEWYTPPEYIERARAALVEIDLDPASSSIAQQTVQAGTYYSRERDALARKWKGRVFLNPPYSNPGCAYFVDKMLAEFGGRRVTEAILLVNNCTETEWFQKAGRAASVVCFPSKRISYLNPAGERVGSPTQGQAFMYFGSRARAFIDEFRPIGLVLTPL